jgi:Zn-finger nucleic acid-binding protein
MSSLLVEHHLARTSCSSLSSTDVAVKFNDILLDRPRMPISRPSTPRPSEVVRRSPQQNGMADGAHAQQLLLVDKLNLYGFLNPDELTLAKTSLASVDVEQVEQVAQFLFSTLLAFIESVETDNELLKEEKLLACEEMDEMKAHLSLEIRDQDASVRVINELATRVRELEEVVEHKEEEHRRVEERLRRQMIEESEKLEDQLMLANAQRLEAEEEAEISHKETQQFQKQLKHLQQQYSEAVEETKRLQQTMKEKRHKSVDKNRSSMPDLEMDDEDDDDDSYQDSFLGDYVGISSVKSRSNSQRQPSRARVCAMSGSPLEGCDKLCCCGQVVGDIVPSMDAPGDSLSIEDRPLYCDVNWLRTSNLQLLKIIEQSNTDLNRTLQNLSHTRTQNEVLRKECELAERQQKRSVFGNLFYGKRAVR